MKLVLTVVSQTGTAMETMTLDRQSATIGRAQDNNLVLEDPRRYISSHHAVIEFRDPDYYLTDTSTNGVLLNNAVQPVGKGNAVRLNDGDQLHIGDYTVSVKILADQETAAEIPVSPSLDEQFPLEEDPFADFGKDAVQEMIDENQLVPDDWQGTKEESDQVLEFPAFEEPAGREENAQASAVEQPPAYKEAFEPFHGKDEKEQAASADIFAEDWYLDKKEQITQERDPFAGDFFAEPGDGESRPATEPDKIAAPTEKADIFPPGLQRPNPPQPETQSESIKDVDNKVVFAQAVEQFLRGAGLEGSSLQQTLSPESFYIIGNILRASIQGTLDVLIGRAKIKNEMHLDVTMIRSRQNNPIKFSVSAEEAMKKLLAPEDAGYLSAEEAIEEAFEDIKAHQYSVIAGMQTALLEVMKRFDPQKLERRLQQESPISASIPVHKQAKLWRLFEHLYKDIEREATDNFYHLFGQAFAETYQQQINQLKNAKKEPPF